MENNSPCICGHSKSQHVEAFDWADGVAACMISSDSPAYHLCVFKMDNLRFLEQKCTK